MSGIRGQEERRDNPPQDRLGEDQVPVREKELRILALQEHIAHAKATIRVKIQILDGTEVLGSARGKGDSSDAQNRHQEAYYHVTTQLVL